jgi:hypothetical protein
VVSRPSGSYRLARALRRAATVAIVLIVVLIATEAYSAIRLASSSPHAGSLEPSFGPNDTMLLTGSFYLTNDGLYPLSGLSIAFQVFNATGALLGSGTAGPASAAPGQNASIAAVLRLPVDASSPGASLLTLDQTLSVDVVGNVTVGYLFPVSLAADLNHTWGAPFANLTVAPGTPVPAGSDVDVPVTVTFSDDASFADVGSVAYAVVPTSNVPCTNGSWAIDVPAGTAYDQTQTIVVPDSCPTTGTVLTLAYSTDGVTVSLPPEAFP